MIEFRIANKDDALQISELHSRYISWGFLSSLGNELLTCLYKSLISFPKGVIIVAISNGNTIGYVSGVLSLKKFYLFFLKKCFLKVVPIITCELLKLNTINLRKILETFLYPSRQANNQHLPKAELLSIVVSEDHQNSNVASSLFLQLKGWFEENETKEFKTTVGATNLKSIRFFEKMECKIVGATEIHKGEASKIFLYSYR